jgi:predicted metal-dependent HD superfamily phosphohydrolase
MIHNYCGYIHKGQCGMVAELNLFKYKRRDQEMLFNELLVEAQNFVFNLFMGQTLNHLCFHDYTHTLQVVQAVEEITYNLNEEDERKELLLVAAWFHDTGYCKTYLGHEKESQQFAWQFLQGQGLAASKIQVVLDCIQATNQAETPQNALEEIMRDADFIHLSSPEYWVKLQSLRQEWQYILNKSHSDYDWLQENLKFLQCHKYYTDYAQANWSPGKEVNIDHLSEEIFQLLGSYMI